MASGATPNYSIPYPVQTDPVDVAGDVEQLATRIDTYIKEWIQDAIGGDSLVNGTYTNGISVPVYNDTTGTISLSLTQDLQVTASPTFVNLNLTGSILTPSVIDVTSSTNALRITQKGSGNALLVEDSANTDSSPFIINSDGQIVSGTTTAFNGYNTSLQLIGTDSLPNGGINTRRISDSSTGQSIFIEKARGTVASPQSVFNGDEIGGLIFNGFDGTNWVPTSKISSIVDGVTGTGDMPGAIVFSTTPNNYSTLSERMRITNVGFVGINTSSPTSELHVNGTITGSNGSFNNIISNSSTITNISSTSIISTNISTSTPVSSNDVATKAYVDGLSGSIAQEVIMFDDISSDFDGQTNRFFLTNNLNATKIYNRTNMVVDPSFEGTQGISNRWNAKNIIAPNNATSLIRKNLIPNPSFEINTTGWISQGTDPLNPPLGNPLTLSVSNNFSLFGNTSLRCVASVSQGGPVGVSTTNIPVIGGQPYTASLYYYLENNGVILPELYITWLDNLGQIIETTSPVSGVWSPDLKTWYRIVNGVSQAPSGATQAYIAAMFYNVPSGTSIYIDGVLFENSYEYDDNTYSAKLNNYFDGSIVDLNSEFISSSWSGIPNNSVSTLVYYHPSTQFFCNSSVMSRSYSEKYIGNCSVKIETNGSVINQGANYFLGSLSANTTYTVSAYIKPESGRPISMTFYDRNNNIYSSSSSTFGFNWQRLTVTMTTGSLPTTGSIIFRTDATLGASVFYIDAVMCEQTDQLFDYFDGDNAPISAGRIIQKPAWQLNKNNSISTIEYCEPGEFKPTNPNRLQLSINGIIQTVSYPEYVWQSMFPQDGFTVDSDGYVTFSEAPVRGSKFTGRYINGNTTVAETNKRRYPFRPIDILLGS